MVIFIYNKTIGKFMKHLILPVLLLLSTTLFAIQPEWVKASIDAHIKLGFEPLGSRLFTYDPADSGDSRIKKILDEENSKPLNINWQEPLVGYPC